MSQKTKRGSVTVEDKGRTESPVQDMKKKAVSAAEKVPEKPAEKVAAVSQNSAKGGASVGQNSATPSQSNGKNEPIAKQSAKPAEKKDDKTKAESVNSTEAAKQNGSDKERQTNGKETLNGNGTAEAVNGTNGSSEHKPEAEVDVAGEEDERFPELEYEEGSDEEGAPPARSTTRRDQVKVTKTPETPRPASNKTEKAEETANNNDGKSNTKLLKLREECSSSPRKLRSAEEGSGAETPESDGDTTGKESKSGEGTVKRDTNYSKSRIKVSPYRRSTRLQDSMLANYTGNNTTMEMDISACSEAASTSEPPLETSYASRRSIRGRKSYKQLGEFVPTPYKRDRDLTVLAGSRPTVHVVGRKRKTLEEDDTDVSIGEEAVEPPAPAKRVRLLNRLMTPLASLVRLPSRHACPAQIVGINSDLPLHGSVDIEPEALPVETEAVKTAPAVPSTPETGVEVRELNRQKCVVM